MFWQAVSAIAAVVYALAFLATFWYVHNQLREMKKAGQTDTHIRRLQSIGSILRYIEDRDISRARWFAYQYHERLEALLDQPFDDEFKRMAAIDEQIHKLSAYKLDLQAYLYPVIALNIVGYLIMQGYVEGDIVPEMLDSTFLRTWRVYKKFIEHRRANRILPEADGSQYPAHDTFPAESKYGKYLEAVVMTMKA